MGSFASTSAGGANNKLTANSEPKPETVLRSYPLLLHSSRPRDHLRHDRVALTFPPLRVQGIIPTMLVSLPLFLSAFVTTLALPTAPPAVYHSTDALLTSLRTVASSCPHASVHWASVIPSPATTQAQHARLLVITISLNLSTLPLRTLHARPVILAAFGEHGRERITSELALSTLRFLCTLSPPVLSRARIVLLPLVNDAGRRLVEAGDVCHRGNAAAVDVNRNFVLRWGVRDSGTSLDEDSPGPHPLSEPESRVLDAVANTLKPAAYVSVHSGETAVLTPWDHGGVAVRGIVRDLAGFVASVHCRGCPVGNAAATIGYRAYGTGADHMHGVIGVPFVYTLEVYGDGDARDDECERMFNPMRKEQFEEVMRNWSDVLGTVSRVVLGVQKRSWPTKSVIVTEEEVRRWRTGYRVVFAEDQQGLRLKRLDQLSIGWVCALLAALAVGALLGRLRKLHKRLLEKNVKGDGGACMGSARRRMGSSGASR